MPSPPLSARLVQAATSPALAMLIGLPFATDPAHAVQTTRQVHVDDNSAAPGQQRIEKADDGLFTVTYRHKNNGRRPELTERFRLAPDATFSEHHVEGLSTMGAQLDEHCGRQGEPAEWRPTSERGGAALAGPARAAEQVDSAGVGGHRGPGAARRWPHGAAARQHLSRRPLDELVLAQGGATRRVQLVLQTGLGLQPAFMWASTGPAPRLFAFGGHGSEIFIEDGWHSSRAALNARQLTAQKAVLRDTALSLRHPLPGLFDLHGHVGRWEGSRNLAAGVTTVRGMGKPTLQGMLDETAAGTLLSPQIVRCGFLDGKSPFSSSFGFTISTLAEARGAVDWSARRGYPQLKIYNSFPKDLLRETVACAYACAHRRGMRVSGYVPAFMRVEEVLEQGFDEIQHINQPLLDFLVTPTTDTRAVERFRLPAAKRAGLDFDSRPVPDFIALSGRYQTVIDPTLATFDFIQQRDGEMSAPCAAVADHLLPDIQRGLRVGEFPIPDDATAERYRASCAKVVDFVGRLYRAGVPLVAGTDACAGITLAGELALYVKAGLTPAQVLQIATLNGATHTRTLAVSAWASWPT